jgi:TonB family protein
MRAAVEALSTYLTLAPPGPETEGWRHQLKTMRAYSGVNQPKQVESSTASASPRLGDFARVVILSKPEPIYTLAARRAGVRGTVILRAVFSARGTVDDILVLRSLPYGLTEETITAAKRIKFKPATNGGQPVSMFLQLEYHFNVD